MNEIWLEHHGKIDSFKVFFDFVVLYLGCPNMSKLWAASTCWTTNGMPFILIGGELLSCANYPNICDDDGRRF